MGDFNEVRTNDERRGSWFNSYNASLFDQFISSSGLVDVKIRVDIWFTLVLIPSANKMSKLDRFLVSDGVISLFPSITAVCLDRHLSDHRPILLCEVKLDYGPIPFRLYHFIGSVYVGVDDMVEQSWRSFSHFYKNSQLSCSKQSILKELRDIDKELDQGGVSDSSLLRRHELKCQLNDIKAMEATDSLQKSKVRWAIEGDENSKYFHGIINKKRSHLAIRGVFDEGIWLTDPSLVKKAFIDHYGTRFKKPTMARLKLNFSFPNRLSQEQASDLERRVSRWRSVRLCWDCGEREISPGPDCVPDAKFVNDYRPISLIGSVYKVVTKIMANRLALVIADIVSETQSAFVAERQILDGPFILNERLWRHLLVVSIMQNKFRYLGVMVGECMSRHKAWDDVVLKLRTRLSKWKAKTLSIGGRLTLLKSVLGASPLYTMSIFKVPKGLCSERQLLFGLCQIQALCYGSTIDTHSIQTTSIWSSILREVQVLKANDKPFRDEFPRMFCPVSKQKILWLPRLADSLEVSLRRLVRGGLEQHDGDFSVKEVRNVIYELYLPSQSESTRSFFDRLLVRYVSQVRKMFIMSSFVVPCLGLFYNVYVDGEILIGRIGPHFRSGILVFFYSDFI
ncbi:RNA-directed DNA polymerase, eukaryota [Tanacetum coccineum]